MVVVYWILWISLLNWLTHPCAAHTLVRGCQEWWVIQYWGINISDSSVQLASIDSSILLQTDRYVLREQGPTCRHHKLSSKCFIRCTISSTWQYFKGWTDTSEVRCDLTDTHTHRPTTVTLLHMHTEGYGDMLDNFWTHLVLLTHQSQGPDT